MNWGRPDWRNPEAYHPRSKRYDFRNPRILTEWFRWQFLRRRADYRADWRANITPESPVYKGEHP